MPTFNELLGLEGLHISKICPRGYTNDIDSHCAHFVGHILGIKFGFTCGSMTKGTGAAASIRVDDIFRACPSVGEWSARPVTSFWGLVFITNAANVNLRTHTMAAVRRKHIGIYLGVVPSIWHYCNGQRRVIRQTQEQFARHYPAPDNALFWGSPP